MAIVVFNIILILCAAAAAVSGFVNGMGDDIDTLGFTGLLLPLPAFGLIVLKALRSPSGKIGAPLFLWPVALILLSRSLFTADLQDIYLAYLVTAVLLPAILRTESVWLAVFLFATVTYPAQIVIEQKIWVEPPQDISFYSGVLEFFGIAFFVGLVPWLILRKRCDAIESEFNGMLEEVRNNAITDAMARARTLSPDAAKKAATATGNVAPDGTATASMNANTIKIDSTPTDTLALFDAGGDEVNLQLKSMLFFMRYNFKGLTASAFIYDVSKRALVLNCYDTKGGVMVKDNVSIPFGAGIIGQVAADNNKNSIFMSGDLSLYGGGAQDLAYYAMQQQYDDIYSALAAPIISGTGEFLGVLAVDSTNKNAFTEAHKEQMRRFATIAAALIVNIRMTLTLEQDAKVFRVFYEVSRQFSIALKMEEIFSVLTAMVPKIVPSCTRQIIVWHEPNGMLRLRQIAGTSGELKEGLEFSPDSGGIYSYAFKKKCTVNIPDLQAQRSYRFVPEETPNPMTRSLIILPIVNDEEQKCLGLLSIESNVPNLFRGDLEQHLMTIMKNAYVALARSLLYLEMEKRATTDGLTGLNNHRTFQEIMAREFERSRRHGHPLSLLLTDIDHFKSFNDTYGHPVGDLVLREIAACIRNTVRLNDFPARYGGEEFAVILPETAEQGAMIIAERIRQAVEARVIESGSNMLRVTISVGCVTFPTYGKTQQEMIDCSDKALYTSKKSGRNRVTMYDPSMTVASK